MATTSIAPRLAQIAHDDFTAWLDGYTNVHIDMGTGDGAFALHMARRHPETAVLGIDTCLDNLTKAARKAPGNLRFLTGDATEMPAHVNGKATGISINFPYGSLLGTLVSAEDKTWQRLLGPAHDGSQVDIRINASACQDYGLDFETTKRYVERALRSIAPRSTSVTAVPQKVMRTFPSTWAKRLAYGRPSRVIVATATMGL
jgi:predicted RNA methylase